MRLPWHDQADLIGERRVLIEALDAEVDRQRASLSARSGSLMNRASILVGSAGIFTALQSTGSWSFWFAASVVGSALAAIMGVLVLLPRLGGEVDIQQAEADYWNNRDTEAIRNLSAYKLKILRQDEKALKARRRLLIAGFVGLGLSVCFASVQVLFPNR